MSGDSDNEHPSAETGSHTDEPVGQPSATHTAAESRSPRRSSAALAVALMVMALVLIALVAALWWQHRQLEVLVHQSDDDAAVVIERVRDADTRLRDIEARLEARLVEQRDAVNRTIAEQQRLSDQAVQRLDSLPGRLSDLETRIDAMQGGSLDARERWLRIEAEHYLSLANEELQLAGRWDSAIRALELADDRLRQLANPAFGPVRDRIAQDLLILRGVERPDIESIVRVLGSLSARAASLPLRSGVEPARLAAPDLDEVEPGLSRLWRSMQMALHSIVSVERRDTPVERTLSADERALVRRQLEVALEMAKLAVMREMPVVYQEGLRTAATVLEQEFQRDHSAVQGALETLNELQETDVAPQRPDISESLALLRRLTSGDR